jgi:hypothetical protein
MNRGDNIMKIMRITAENKRVETEVTPVSRTLAIWHRGEDDTKFIIHVPSGFSLMKMGETMTVTEAEKNCTEAERLPFNWDCTGPATFNPKVLDVGDKSPLFRCLRGEATAAECLIEMLTKDEG